LGLFLEDAMSEPAIVPDHVSDPPQDLSEPSRALWSRLSADLAVLGRASEAALIVLADALRLRERADVLARAVESEGATVLGSTGQPRPHPAMALEAKLRADAEATLRSLGVVDVPYTHRVGADGRIRGPKDKRP